MNKNLSLKILVISIQNVLQIFSAILLKEKEKESIIFFLNDGSKISEARASCYENLNKRWIELGCAGVLGEAGLPRKRGEV